MFLKRLALLALLLASPAFGQTAKVVSSCSSGTTYDAGSVHGLLQDTSGKLCVNNVAASSGGAYTDITSVPTNTILGRNTAGVGAAQALTAPLLLAGTGTAPGLYVGLTGDTVARISLGVNTSDIGRVGFGPGGSTARETFITRGTNGGLDITNGTVTLNAPLLNLTQTRNAAGVTFQGIVENITDTNSAAASTLMDLQVEGASKFNVSKSGNVYIPVTNGAYNVNLAGTAAVYGRTGAFLTFFASSGDAAELSDTNAGFTLRSNFPLSWGSSGISSPDLFLLRDAANTLAQRNGTNAQKFNLYRTYTDASNYERIQFIGGSSYFGIESQAAGTGTQRNLILANNAADIMIRPISLGTNGWKFSSTGHLLAEVDNTYDIGASGATRPRNVYVAGALVIGSAGDAITSSGHIQIGNAKAFYWATQGGIYNAADGVFTLKDNAGTSFGRLQFGGTTSSFPSLKRSAAILVARLANDSANGAFEASTIDTDGYTVAGLPAAGVAGRRAYVTDQLTTCAVVGAALTGGGALSCPVFDNGTAWVGD